MIPVQRKIVLIMVGLPARGKSFFASKVFYYLEWLGYRVRIFNAGRYRREMLGPQSSRSDFFDPRVPEFREERERIAKLCFGDCVAWLKDNGEIAIYDATNVTKARRAYCASECERHGFDHIFIESICNDTTILSRIITEKVMHSPDYAGTNEKSAREDFLQRVAHYETIYEPILTEYESITIHDFGARTEDHFSKTNDLFTEIFSYVRNVHSAKKDVYLSRHGETEFNLQDRIGGDAPLTDSGKDMARALAAHFKGKEDIVVMTSDKQRTRETAAFSPQPSRAYPALDEIRSGVCDSMTYAEIAETYPDIETARKEDKFNFRYPDGESYHDLIWRVRTAIWEIEAQQNDVVVIGHRAVNRCIYSYFIPTASAQIPYIDMPLKTVMRIRPHDHPRCAADVITL